MLNKPCQNNSHFLYYTPEEKSSKLGLFSASRVVLPLNKITDQSCHPLPKRTTGSSVVTTQLVVSV